MRSGPSSRLHVISWRGTRPNGCDVMRRVFAVAVVTVITLLMLGGALVFFARKGSELL